MKKGRKKAQDLNGLIVKIDDIEVWADFNNYIVKYGTRYCYFGYLEEVMVDILANRIKKELIENDQKDMSEVVKIIKQTDLWARKQFRDANLLKDKI